MLRLLYQIPWVKKEINKLIFSEQSKPPNFEDLDYCFTDSNGMKYYKYRDEFDIPIVRRGRIDVFLQELSNTLTGEEMDMFIEAMEKALNKGKTEMAKVGFLITEIKERKRLLLHPEILMKIAGALYIREDQNPAAWDAEIEAEKIKQFNKDSQGGLYDFFYNAGLKRYIPYIGKLEGDWKEYLEACRTKIKALNQTMATHTSNPKYTKKYKMTDTK